ncbi:MAG: hypothetical protein E6Q97_33810 [Desulfurellales bacterium]|nr:MAG: hypothetical protein E6Q97_33810 [Desulfurellales bacterium]
MADWLSSLLGVGSSLLSAGAGIYASDQAADAGAAAADKSAAAQLKMYNQTREDLTPQRKVGETALYSLADLSGIPRVSPDGGLTPAGGFNTTPGYQFRLGEGIKALDRSAAARGMVNSGAQMKAVQRYGEGLASDEWNNYVNNVARLAGYGSNATNTQTSANQALASGLSNSAIAGGQARVSGYANMGNIAGNAIGQLPLYAYLYGRS